MKLLTSHKLRNSRQPPQAILHQQDKSQRPLLHSYSQTMGTLGYPGIFRHNRSTITVSSRPFLFS